MHAPLANKTVTSKGGLASYSIQGVYILHYEC